MAARFRKTKKKASLQTIFVSLVLSVLALGLIAFLAISNWKINEKRKDLNAEIEAAKTQVEILKEREDFLKAGLSETEKQDFQEEKIRDQGYKKSGEEVIAVLQDNKPVQEGPTQKKEPDFWMGIWDKIKNIKP